MSNSVPSSPQCPMHILSKLKLSKLAELDHSSNFDKWPPNSIESDPGPLERIIMHFRPKLATQEACNHPMNDPPPTQKKWSKLFLDQKCSKSVWQRFLRPQNRLFGGGAVEIFSALTKGVPKPSEIFLVIPNPFLGSVGFLDSKIADVRPKSRNFWSRFGRNFCMWVSGAPQKFFLN